MFGWLSSGIIGSGEKTVTVEKECVPKVESKEDKG